MYELSIIYFICKQTSCDPSIKVLQKTPKKPPWGLPTYMENSWGLYANMENSWVLPTNKENSWGASYNKNFMGAFCKTLIDGSNFTCLCLHSKEAGSVNQRGVSLKKPNILIMNFAFLLGVLATKISIQCVKLKKTQTILLFFYVLLMKHIECMY